MLLTFLSQLRINSKIKILNIPDIKSGTKCLIISLFKYFKSFLNGEDSTFQKQQIQCRSRHA